VPAGTVLTPSGSITVHTAGAVINAKDISGTLVVDAPNVTVRRTRIRANGNPIDSTSNAIGLMVEDSELDGGGANGTCVGVFGGAAVRRTNIHGCENGLNSSGSGTVTNNYIHDLTTANGAHTDGVQISQGSHDVLFRHNTISPQDAGRPASTSAIIMWNAEDPQNTRVRIESNRLDGSHASFALYAPRQSASDIYINNNRMLAGVAGYTDSVRVPTTVTEFTGNVDDVTGVSVQPGE
jgi:CBS domain-containing protein